MSKKIHFRLLTTIFLAFIAIICIIALLFFRPKHEDIILIDNDWFYVINSAIQKNYTGIKSNDEGIWRIVDGKVDFSANGLVPFDSDLYYFQNGKLDIDANGLFRIDSDLYYLNSGVVDDSFNGIASFDSSFWFVDSGIVNLSYSGVYSYKDTLYNIVDGRASVQSEYVSANNNDGCSLYGYVFKPAVFNDNTLIICHGIADSSERFTKLAQFLAENGYTVFAFDFSGGGAYSRSDGETTEMSVLTELADLDNIYSFVAGQSFVDPQNIYLAGHSQGGIVSGIFAAEDPSRIKGLILYAPGFVICETWAPASYEDIPDQNVYMANDMFVGPVYYSALWSLFKGDREKIYDIMSAYSGPVLMLHGLCDTVTPVEFTRKMSDYYSNSILIEYNNADHFFNGEGIFDILANDTLDFLKDHQEQEISGN